MLLFCPYLLNTLTQHFYSPRCLPHSPHVVAVTCMAYHKEQTTIQLSKGSQTKRIHSKGKWKSRISIKYATKCKLSVKAWVVEGKKQGQGMVRLTLGHLHSPPPGCWRVFEEKNKTVNRWRMKTVWMSLVYMQREKLRKSKYFVTVLKSGFQVCVLFLSYFYFLCFKRICYFFFFLLHNIKSVICIEIRWF